ncbi:MAG: TRZ/ATZ family hydrolase [Xanthomonadales bacterium]|nr:TRZ/ATZ family hydrolase [Xanthomonadales bacterium]
MDTVLLLPRLLVPVRPRLQVLEQMAVVIEGEFISAVMPRSEALVIYEDATRIELPEHVLVPGFINMHTHSAMSLLRGYADDLNLQVWLNEHIWPVEKAFLGPAFVHDGVRLAIAEMLRGGTTFFNDLYFFPEITASAAVEAGMRACIGLPVIDVPTVWATNENEYIDKGLEVSSSWKSEPLISTSMAPHAPYSVGDTALGRIAKISEKRDMRVHMHVLESSWEISESLSRHGKPTLQRLDDVGLMNERLLAVHMTQLNGTDLEALSETAVNVIHCPESNLKLGNGICPVARLIEHNINLALGTDGAASNNNLDLLAESRSAALLAKGYAADPCVLNAFQTLEMLTINAARALGKEHQLGSVQTGKLADLCAIRLDSLQTTPMYDVVSHLIYAASSQQVTHVWVGGRMLLQDKQFLYMDTGDIMDRANDWAKRIATETRATSSREYKIHE